MNETGAGVVGTPDMAIAQIQRLIDQSGGFGAYLVFGGDLADWPATLRSYELIAQYVMPHFQDQLGPPQESYDWIVGTDHTLRQADARRHRQVPPGVRQPSAARKRPAAAAAADVRAVVAREGTLHVETVDEPIPGARPGPRAAGRQRHLRIGPPRAATSSRPRIPRRCRRWCSATSSAPRSSSTARAPTGACPVGALVCSVPFVDGADGPGARRADAELPRRVRRADGAPGAPPPRRARTGSTPSRAAVTEPLAVGVHAVAAAGLARGRRPARARLRADRARRDRRAQGRPVTARSSPPTSRPARRVARRAGSAPTSSSIRRSHGPYDDVARAWPADPSRRHHCSAPSDPAGADRRVRLRRRARALLAQFIEAAPSHSRLVVVGVCATPDSFVPVRAIEKELSIQFVFAYRPEEFAHALT